MLGWELPPHNSGGLGIACYQLCRALSKKSINIEFIIPYSADHGIDFMQVTAAKPQGVASVFRSGIAYDSYKYVKDDGSEEWLNIYDQQELYEHAVAKLVGEKEFDILHAHDWLTFRAGLRAKEITGKPLILHVHSIESDRSGKHGGGNPLVREIEGTAFMIADRIVAVSEHTRQEIHREYDVPLDKIEVVHNNFDSELMIPEQGPNVYAYLEEMKRNGYRVICNIGRITIQKGLVNLIQAFRHVVDYAPKTILLVAGAGEQYLELVELAANLGLAKNVVFADFQRGKGYRDTFTVADLFVAPSISEPFGIGPLESVAYGTPALVSKQTGMTEVIRNVLKVDFWDIDEMANEMTMAIRHQPMLDELRYNSQREYERLSWDRSADTMSELYHRHLQGAAA